MKRTILTLMLGMAAGLAAYFGYVGRHEAPAADNLEAQLAWMKAELKLTDRQFARIAELHRASRPELLAMASQVASMRAEFQEFEQQRRTADQVDFVEFARFVDLRRNLDKACLDSTRRLVRSSAAVMDDHQRRQYLELLSSTEPLVGSLLN